MKCLSRLFLGCLWLPVLASSEEPASPDAALSSFSAPRMLEHIRALASDEFEGRGPGSPGETLTTRYLEDQFRASGLEPGNPDGTYLQSVPLVEITANPSMSLAFTGAAQAVETEPGKDYVAWTKRVVPKAGMSGELVFVGYGVQAPEFGWDDFKGADLAGKVLLVLVNDPPLADPAVFGGKAMTYYGRWTYKFEKAAELGAAGCLIVHDTERAGYPWEVVQSSWSGAQFDLAVPDRNLGRAAVEGWITDDLAAALARLAGKDLPALKAAAATREFQPVPLGIDASLEIQNSLRTFDSHNVIARLTGSDPQLKEQFVVYTAHWDHLGRGVERDGDGIYNGALDNASGTAALLEIAKAFRQLDVAPRRTMLFLAVTAEERGLLGSRYYAEHPLVPLARTAAVINMDGMTVHGRTKDVVSIGAGASTLDEVVAEAVLAQGRVLSPDPEPEKGFFYRSDHFEFAKQGVPAFYPDSGVDFVGRPAGWGLEMRKRYTSEDYHKPSDQVKADWDLSGAVEDSQLYVRVGWQVANAQELPQWKPGAEFRAVREASLRHASAGGSQ